MNDKLWLIKPYIIVNPVRLPDGLPSSSEDIDNFKLLSNGELIDLRKRTPSHVKQIPKPDCPKAIGIKMVAQTQRKTLPCINPIDP